MPKLTASTPVSDFLASTTEDQARSSIHADYYVDIRMFGAFAGTAVSSEIRTANTAAIQSALDTGKPVYIPPGRFEIDDDLIWDLDQSSMFGAGSRLSIIYQTNSAANGITFTTSPEASGVTKSGILERLRIEGVGAGSATGYGLNADKAGSPSHAFLRVRDVYVKGFAQGLHLKRFDNCNFFGCEFNSNAINVYAEAQTRTVTFYNCVNSSATGVSWQVAAGGNVSIWGCDTGAGSQHVLSAGVFIARDSNFEAVNGSGSPNGHIESTADKIVLDNIYMLGNSSTLPAVYYAAQGDFRGVTASGFGAGGGKIRKASASAVGHYSGSVSLSSNRQTANAVMDNAGQFDSLPFGTFDIVRYDGLSTATAANRSLFQFGAGTGSQADRVDLKIYDGSAYSRAAVGLIETKTTTGDPTGHEGRMVINTFDNTLKIYADAAWRTIASW